MKRCPTCQRTFTDESLSYCTDDGTPLVDDAPPTSFGSPDSTPTLVASSPIVSSSGSHQLPPTQAFIAGHAQGGWQAPSPYMPPTSSQPGKRSKLPWIISGVVLLFAGLIVVSIIAAVLLSNKTDNTNTNSVNSNVNTNVSNQNANVSNQNSTPPVNEDESDAPTDKDEVLAQLTKIENEWAEANIRGDKEYLENLLDDSYKGENADGTTQTKEQYLETLTPSETIKSHSLKDLKLTLNGNKAVVNGLITVNFKAGGLSLTYQFTDGFIRRGEGWKAVSSTTSPVQ